MSQNKQLDSLKTRLGITNNPIERFDLLNRIRENYNNYQEGEYDFKWAIEMLRIAQQANNDSMLAISNNVIGGLNAEKSNFTTALEYFFKAIPQAEKAKDKRRISSLYFDISSKFSLYLQGCPPSTHCLYCLKLSPPRPLSHRNFGAFSFSRRKRKIHPAKKLNVAHCLSRA